MIKLFKLLFKWQWKKIILIIIFSTINIRVQLNILEFFPIIVSTIKSQDLEGIMSFLPATIAYVFVSVFCTFILSYLIISVASNFSYNLKEKLFNILLNLKTIDEFNKINYSGVMTRLIRGVDTEQSFMILLFKRILPLIITSVFIVYALTSINYRVAGFFSVILIIFAIIFVFRLNQLANQYFKVKKIYGKLNNLFLSKISSLKTIKLFSKEEYSTSVFKEESDIAYNKGFRFQYKLNFSVIWMILIHLTIIFFIMMCLSFFDDNQDLGLPIFTSVLYIVFLMNHLMSLFSLVSIYSLAYTSSVRIEEVLAMENNYSSPSIKNDFNGIEFKNVSLNISDRKILSDISLKIPQDSKTLIVGPIGSGKTSLIYSLLGFHNIDSGEISVDWNSKVSLTTTKSFLLKGSVFENIALGDESVTTENALSACKYALFPKKLSFEVNEEGNNLSNELKQKLCIARALAQDCEIYIFDNCFTSINSASKKIIKEHIKERLDGKTVIFIDNNCDDYLDVDNIVVLDDGKIVNEGTHNYLIENCSTYKKLFHESVGCNNV